jgi:3'-phosphoadenosine 5'-phosphosulfate sulfotransferase (PAPS reductase)/FAD synthetase
MMSRVVVWFSCGAASAVAAKLATEKYDDVSVVYCDVLSSEHPDNRRFMRDVENWIGQKVIIIKSEKYETVDNVFVDTGYMSGIRGARCTLEMKKIPRWNFERPDDLHIFGYTSDEQKRIKRFEENNPELKLEWILRDAEITKEDCFNILKDSEIELPVMYGLGFKNNNCIGCVKATSPHYWNMVRKYFPDVFKRRAEQSRSIGCRLTRVKGKRIFLDELDSTSQEVIEEDISCGPQCGLEDNEESD